MASEDSWTFGMETLAKLFEALRSVGYEARHHLPKRETQRQYIICGVFSGEEIHSADKVNRQIEEFSRHLLKLCDENKHCAFAGKFICKGRIVVLLNNFGRHGEARLFDPDGTLMRQIDVLSDPVENNDERRRYLDIMKKRFTKEFGSHIKPFIVMLSHLVPCTEEGHKCAKLIREYAVQTDSKVIVSYDNGWQGTNTRLSLEQLRHDNIYVVKPRERRDVVNKELRALYSHRPTTAGSSGRIKLLSNWENDLTVQVTDQKRRSSGKWSSLVDRPVPWDCKKKRREYNRQTSKSEYARDWASRQNSQ